MYLGVCALICILTECIASYKINPHVEHYKQGIIKFGVYRCLLKETNALRQILKNKNKNKNQYKKRKEDQGDPQ